MLLLFSVLTSHSDFWAQLQWCGWAGLSWFIPRHEEIDIWQKARIWIAFFFYPHLFPRMALEPPLSWCCYHYSLCVFALDFFTPRNNIQYLFYCKTSLVFYILIFCIALCCCFSQNTMQISLSVFWHLPLCSLVADVLADLALTLWVHSCPLPQLMCSTEVIFFYKHI